MFIGLSIIDVFLLVAGFPLYIEVNTNNKIVTEAKKTIEISSTAKDRDIVLKNVKDLESRLKIIAMIPGDKPTEYIDKALELKGKDVYIQNISYVKKGDTQKEVSLEGTASSRAGLIEFSKGIKNSFWTKSSDIPLANLVNDKNINFFVTLTASSTSK